MTDAEILLKCQEFGRKLRDSRQAYGISQADLSIHSGIAPRTIIMVERGQVFWTVRTEILLMNSLKILIEASIAQREKTRRFSKHYTLPVVLPPDIDIFKKYK